MHFWLAGLQNALSRKTIPSIGPQLRERQGQCVALLQNFQNMLMSMMLLQAELCFTACLYNGTIGALSKRQQCCTYVQCIQQSTEIQFLSTDVLSCPMLDHQWNNRATCSCQKLGKQCQLVLDKRMPSGLLLLLV